MDNQSDAKLQSAFRRFLDLGYGKGQENELSFPYPLIESKQPRLFLFYGQKKQLFPYLVYFSFLLEIKNAQAYVVLQKEEDSEDIEALGYKVLPSLKEIIPLSLMEGRNYVYAIENKALDVPGEVKELENLGPAKAPFIVLRLDDLEKVPVSSSAGTSMPASISGILSHLLDDIFELGLSEESLFFEAQSAYEFEKLFALLSSTLKPMDKDSECRVLIAKELKKQIASSRFLEASSNDMFHGSISEEKALKDMKGVYFLLADEPEKAKARIEELGKMEKNPKAILVCLSHPSSLHFEIDSLSKLARCPVRIYSPLDAVAGVWLSKEREDFFYRGLAYFRDEIGYYPLSLGQVKKEYEAGAYEFSWQKLPPLYSHYYYEKLYDGKMRSFLGNDSHYLFKALDRSILVPSPSLRLFLSHYYKKDCLLTRFAEFEHIQWARRTLLFASKEIVEGKAKYLVPFAELVANNEKDILDKDVIFPDYLMGLFFLDELFASRKKEKFDITKLPASGQIDVAKLLHDTDISKKELEDLFVSVEEERLLFAEEDSTTLLPKKKFTNCFFALLPGMHPNNYPLPGSIIRSEDGKKFFLLEAYEVASFAKWKSYMQSAFPHSTDESSDTAIIFGKSSDSSLTVLHLLNFEAYLSKSSKLPFNQLLSALCCNPYPLNSPQEAYFKKLATKLLGIGKHIGKGLKTPISSSVSIKNAPFVNELDHLGFLSYLTAYSTYLDEYGDSFANVTETLIDDVISLDPLEKETNRCFTERVRKEGNLRNIVAMIEEYKDSDGDIDDERYPSFFRLPYPVLHRASLPLLGCLLGISEEDAIALADKKLFFDATQLASSSIAYTPHASEGVTLADGLSDVLAILSSPGNPLMEKAFKECVSYPFGEIKARALLFRLAKLGLIKKCTFYHSLIPTDAKMVKTFSCSGSYPTAYELMLEDAVRGTLLLQNGDQSGGALLERGSNFAFTYLLFSHLFHALSLRSYSLDDDVALVSDYKVLEHYKVLDMPYDRFSLSESILAKEAGCRDVDFYFIDKTAMEEFTFAFGTLVFGKAFLRDLFRFGYKRNDDVRQEEGRIGTNLHGWIIPTYGYDVLDGDIDLDGDFKPHTMRFALPGQEEREYTATMRLSYCRAHYLLLVPTSPIKGFGEGEGIFLVERHYGEKYKLVCNRALLENLIDELEDLFDE